MALQKSDMDDLKRCFTITHFVQLNFDFLWSRISALLLLTWALFRGCLLRTDIYNVYKSDYRNTDQHIVSLIPCMHLCVCCMHII